LNDRVRDIRSLQSYMRGREAVFRNTSESTNTRVMVKKKKTTNNKHKHEHEN